MRTPRESVPQPYRFAGAYADPTGLYKMGHRYYDPTLGVMLAAGAGPAVVHVARAHRAQGSAPAR
ncbi:RHS repeat-associated core domain-containing protein [Streptomyces sp. NPDC096191]|uniref:RHS repeat-associated core domain-containing protein n=1 Tax=Streptomyces sp. NPDC096191 TaxID=3155426 RepID=UPI003324CFD5